MKLGFVIVEYHDLETHLNRIKDFTGSRVSMSNKMSLSRTRSVNNLRFSVGRDIGGTFGPLVYGCGCNKVK